MRTLFPLLAVGALSGCSEPPLPGQYYDVSVEMATDGCNDQAVGYGEDFRYRLQVYDGTNQADVAIEGDTFATGSVSGCTISYDSVTWTEERDDGDIRWMLSGEAEVQPGDGSCGNPDDWVGTETYRVLSSDDVDVAPGCEYVVNVRGSFVEEILPE